MTSKPSCYAAIPKQTPSPDKGEAIPLLTARFSTAFLMERLMGPVNINDWSVLSDMANVKQRLAWIIKIFQRNSPGTITLQPRSRPLSCITLNLRDLAEKCITSLHFCPTLDEFKDLKHLDISGNLLLELPHSVCHLKGLLSLNADNNRISSIPPCINQLDGLESLSLCGNRLQELKRNVFSLKKLKFLRISNNQITEIPEYILFLEGLEVLEMDNNLLQWLPAAILIAKKLYRISLKGNPFLKENLLLGIVDGRAAMMETLREASAKSIKGQLLNPTRGRTTPLTPQLCQYLKNNTRCSYCNSPFFCPKYIRFRLVLIGQQMFPIAYSLCSPHWADERDYFRVVFSGSNGSVITMPDRQATNFECIEKCPFERLTVVSPDDERLPIPIQHLFSGLKSLLIDQKWQQGIDRFLILESLKASYSEAKNPLLA